MSTQFPTAPDPQPQGGAGPQPSPYPAQGFGPSTQSPYQAVAPPPQGLAQRGAPTDASQPGASPQPYQHPAQPGTGFPAQPVPPPGAPYPAQAGVGFPGQTVPPGAAYPAWPAPLPAEQTIYPRFFRVPGFKRYKAVLAAVLGLAAFFVVSIILSAVWVAVELATGSMTLESLSQLNMSNVVTPSFFLLNNLSLVACIGIAMAFAAIFFRQRPGWLASVQGRFRWGFFGRCLLIAAPIIAVDLVAEALIAGPWELRLRDHTVFMIVVILLTTPLQCAGEEYLCRGLINRGFGSLPKGRTAGVATGALVSTAVFAVLHGATDPYLIVFYCFFGLACCLLAWKTGGLEAAIAVHAANNVLGMWMVPFTDFSGMFDRGAGTGSPVVLLQMAALALACWLILRQAKRLGLPETGPPPAVTPGR